MGGKFGNTGSKDSFNVESLRNSNMLICSCDSPKQGHTIQFMTMKHLEIPSFGTRILKRTL